MKACLIAMAAATTAVIALPARSAPPVPGERWETTTQMEMPGMGMAMPARTQEICRAKNSDQPPVSSPPDSNCEMSDVKSAGGTTSWKMRCTGEHPMTGDGEMTYEGKDKYHGKMTMNMQEGSMTMKMSGKRLDGDCDAGAAVANMVAVQKQSEQMKAQTCSEAARNMQVQIFDGTYAADCGPKAKAEFCKRLSTEEGYDQVAVRDKLPTSAVTDLQSAGKTCIVDTSALKDKLCKNAQAGNSLLFLARHCPGEAAPLAQAQCAGRSFSSPPAEQYREFCSTYARHNLMQGSGSSGAAAGAAGSAHDSASGADGSSSGETGQGTAPPQKDNALEQGKKALKKLFPF